MKNESSFTADSSPSSSSSSCFLLEEFRRNLQKLWLRDPLVFVPGGRTSLLHYGMRKVFSYQVDDNRDQLMHTSTHK